MFIKQVEAIIRVCNWLKREKVFFLRNVQHNVLVQRIEVQRDLCAGVGVAEAHRLLVVTPRQTVIYEDRAEWTQFAEINTWFNRDRASRWHTLFKYEILR